MGGPVLPLNRKQKNGSDLGICLGQCRRLGCRGYGQRARPEGWRSYHPGFVIISPWERQYFRGGRIRRRRTTTIYGVRIFDGGRVRNSGAAPLIPVEDRGGGCLRAALGAPGFLDGGEYRDRTCASQRTRRVSTALPYRSANSPIQNGDLGRTSNLRPCRQSSDGSQLTNDGALDWTRTSIGPFRRRLTIQLVHERMLEAPAGAAPAHGGFADRRVPVSPRG